MNLTQRCPELFDQITEGYRRFAFYGAMGSGKTTLIKAICKELGAIGYGYKSHLCPGK